MKIHYLQKDNEINFIKITVFLICERRCFMMLFEININGINKFRRINFTINYYALFITSLVNLTFPIIFETIVLIC